MPALSAGIFRFRGAVTRALFMTRLFRDNLSSINYG